MPIEFNCTDCQNPMRTPDASAGKKGRCPKCGSIQTIPTAGGGRAGVSGAAASGAVASGAGAIEFPCTACGQQVRTPASAAGKKGRCPHCKAVVDVPVASVSATASEPLASRAVESPEKTKLSGKKPAGESIDVSCPSCQKVVRTPASAAGKKGKCPHCATVIDIPLSSVAENPATGNPAGGKKAAKSGTIAFACSHCQNPITAPSSTAGKRARCPKCKGVVSIPSASSGTTPSSGLQPLGGGAAGLTPLSGDSGLTPLADSGAGSSPGLTPLDAGQAGGAGLTPLSDSTAAGGGAGLTPLGGSSGGQTSGSGLTPLTPLSDSSTGAGGSGLTPLGGSSGGQASDSGLTPLTPLSDSSTGAGGSGLTPLGGSSGGQASGSGLTPLTPLSDSSTDAGGSGLTPLGGSSGDQTGGSGLTPLTPLSDSAAGGGQGLTPLDNESGLGSLGGSSDFGMSGGGLSPLAGSPMPASPYASPSAYASAQPTRGGGSLSTLKAPAICLIVVSSLWLLFAGFSLLANIFLLAVGELSALERPLPGISAGVQLAINLAWSVVLLAVNALILLGAIGMLKGRNLGLAKTAAILAIVPCVGPCYVLGIPFGIWSLVVLNSGNVASEFR